ncbi:MAG: hypothetical protein ACLSBL_03935 [Ezakiella massiliensis]
MKSIKSVVLITIAIVFLLTIKTLAFNPADVETIQNEDGSITKIYKRNVNASLRSAGNVDYEETKKMLLELGMEQDFIDNLTEEDLEHYSNSTNLVGTITYYKTDENNNKTVVSETQAYEEVNKIKNNIALRGAQDNETYEDSYMRVYHLVSQYRDTEEFLFSTDARWLIMPYFRDKDSIGSCAIYVDADTGSGRGYYSYDITTNRNGRIENNQYYKNIFAEDFQDATTFEYSGMATVIELPSDIERDGYNIVHTNFKAHAQHYASISFPDSRTRFRSYGTYDHSRLTIDRPTISIDVSGATIGLGIRRGSEKRTAKVNVEYIPR